MSYIDIEFGKELLKEARRDAKAYGVKIPRNLTALHSHKDQWFVQGKDDDGLYVEGSNAYVARADYINKRIREAHPQLEEAANA